MTVINPIYQANITKAQISKLKIDEPATVSNPSPQNVSFRGTEALAAYNYNLVNKNNDFDIPTISPIEIPEDITKIGGTPVYDSKGNLVLVEKIIGNEKYVYHNMDNLIQVFDKDGNKIKEQGAFINLNRDKSIIVTEFILGKKDCYSSQYISIDGGDFKLFENSKYVFYPDGSRKEFMYNVQEKEYEVIERSNNRNFNKLYDRILFYDENKNLKEVWEGNSNTSITKKINYQDNIAYQIEEEKNEAIPNDILKKMDILSDKDLKPYKKIDFIKNAQDVEGEKTYYSNGKVESNTFMQDGKKVKYCFMPNGEIRNVFLDNITIECDDENCYSICEKLENGAERYTTHSDVETTVSYCTHN